MAITTATASYYAAATIVLFLLACNSAPAQGAPSPSPLTVQFFIRDQMGQCDGTPILALQQQGYGKISGSTCACGANTTTFWDDERAIADDRAYPSLTLAANRKPYYAPNPNTATSTLTNAVSFSAMWNDPSAEGTCSYAPGSGCTYVGANYKLTESFTLTWDSTTNLYVYNNQAFFPIDGKGFGNYCWNKFQHNFGFCLEYHTGFTYQGNELFSFIGDDDVLFYINGLLWVNLGGVHIHEPWPPNGSTAALADSAAQLGLTVGNNYNFDLFYCERHTVASTILIGTSIQLNNCPTIDACGVCNGNTTVDNCIVNGQPKPCGNGTCVCELPANGTCACTVTSVGTYSNGPNGPCSQLCGDGIIEGSETCDPGQHPTAAQAACCKNCQVVASGTSCSSAEGSNPNSCINYVCDGNGGCGVNIATGTTCTPPSNSPAAATCQGYICTAGNPFNTCQLQNLPGSACINGLCGSGVCDSNGVGGYYCAPNGNANPCSGNDCHLAPTCNPLTGCPAPWTGTQVATGTSCTTNCTNSNPCTYCGCSSSGQCTITNLSNGPQTGCSSIVNNGCGQQTCQAGQCVTILAANPTPGNCPGPAPACQQPACSASGACTFQAIQDGTGCSNSGAGQCSTGQCSSGTCVLVATNNGDLCTSSGAAPACQKAVCSNQQCVFTADSTKDNTACGANNTCNYFSCKSGTCTSIPQNAGQGCGNVYQCARYQCDSAGNCNANVSFNSGSSCGAITGNNGCQYYICQNAACVVQNTTNGTPCTTGNNQCYDDGACLGGICKTVNVTCSSPCVGITSLCNSTTGTCYITGSSASSCCGNGIIDPGEQCDNPNDPCCTSTCTLRTGQSCSPNPCVTATCTLTYPACSSGSSPTCGNDTCVITSKTNTSCTNVALTSSVCQVGLCTSLGQCAAYNVTEGTNCTDNTLTPGMCGQTVCVGGICSVVSAGLTGVDCSTEFLATPGATIPACQAAQCNAVSAQCQLVPLSGGVCNALPANDCANQTCTSGTCTYVPFANYTTCSSVTASNPCAPPSCLSGNCVLQPPVNNATASTIGCTTALPAAQCGAGQCAISPDGTQGICVAVPQNQNTSCTASFDIQCQVALCTGLECEVFNVTDGSNCTNPDTFSVLCQTASCQGGKCVNAPVGNPSVACTPLTVDPSVNTFCNNYFCSATAAACVPVAVPDGTACTSPNLCYSASCAAGLCQQGAAIVSCVDPNPPPCENPKGVCNAQTGKCVYSGIGQYTPCVPLASQVVANCNYSASTPNNYVCNSNAPNSVCAPACFQGAVCGDGVVEKGEQCDWADPTVGGPCCNTSDCQWFHTLASCNYSGTPQAAAQNALLANFTATSGLPAYCFPAVCILTNGHASCVITYDSTLNGCGAQSGSSNKKALIGALVAAGLLAVIIGAGAFLLWWRGMKQAEGAWLKEYMDAGNHEVVTSPAFVAPDTNIQNPAFDHHHH